MTGGIYPWQEAAWRRLRDARAAGRLPHALLIAGKTGMGKRRLAEHFSKSLLCGSPDEQGSACGSCRSCRYIDAGTHPDFLRIEPEDEGKPIRIDAIRSLLEWSVRTSQDGGERVTVIDPADRMNRAAANSLLKTLEEPVAGSYLLLVSAQPALLPATVRSRCQTLPIHPPSEKEAVNWLTEQDPDPPWPLLLGLAQDAPLGALELARTDALALRSERFSRLEALCAGTADPLVLAAEWTDDSARTLQWLASWLRDLVRLGFGIDQLENPDLAAPMQALVERLDLQKVLGLEERLQTALQTWRHANLNPRLQMEDLVISLVESRR